jgi:hypothetical protein
VAGFYFMVFERIKLHGIHNAPVLPVKGTLAGQAGKSEHLPLDTLPTTYCYVLFKRCNLGSSVTGLSKKILI